MARRRGSRRAPRFDEQYQSGYQYRYPERDAIKLGPWEGIWPLGDRQTPQNMLSMLHNGLLRDGNITGLWNYNTASNFAGGGAVILGAYELVSPVADNLVVFYTQSGITYARVFADAYNVYTNITLPFTTTARIHAVVWQNTVYFGYSGGAGLYKFDLTAKVVSAVASTPAPEFLFLHDNNLVVIYKSGNAYLIEWSVDSDPEDFSGIGSGQAVLSYGNVKAAEPFMQDYIILTDHTAYQMSPTGTAEPAFILTERNEFNGTPYKYCSATSGKVIYGVGYDRKLYAYDGNLHVIGEAAGVFRDQPVLFYEKRLGLLFVSCTDPYVMLLLDPNTMTYVGGRWDHNIDFVAGSPSSDGDHGFLLTFTNASGSANWALVRLDYPGLNTPITETGYVNLEREAWIDYIDVFRLEDEAAPVISKLIITRKLQDGIDDSTTLGDISSHIGVHDYGRYIRYYVSSPARAFKIRIEEAPTGFVYYGYINPTPNANGNYTAVDTPVDGYDLVGLSDGKWKPLSPILGGGFYGVEKNVIGNYDTFLSKQLWDRNQGISHINVYYRELSRGNPTTA